MSTTLIHELTRMTLIKMEKEQNKNLKSKIAEREEEILKFWQENKIFEKSLAKEAPKGEFVFYEGPPTANAKPALHHLESRVFKDAIPRYKTMRGFHVRRKAGWDTHGLPVELQVEKKLGLKSKKDIEKYGVKEFNKHCRDSVFEYIGDWEKFTDRIGYWVLKNDAYYTFDSKYIESVWNILKTINNKKLLYKDYKVLPWCPRCGTALSSHELAQGYEDIKDLSVTVKFKVVGEENTYLLAWTTTPWTLPGNVALAVGEGVDYVKIKTSKEFFILARARLSAVGEDYEIVAEMKGEKLLGFAYESLYPYLANNLPKSEEGKIDKAFKVYNADFVTTEDGTGVVHTAVMYGQDDFVLGNEIGLPKVHLVNEDGTFKEGMDFLSGRFVKDETTDVEIIKDLAHRGLLFKKEKYEHSYPHCWRCKTPLIYYARDSWYIKMSDLRGKLMKENEKINWEPANIKEGRFGEWLKEVKDWAISRERYWGTPLPIWQDSEGEIQVTGSIAELRQHVKKSGNQYFTLRHGEAEQNIADTINADPRNIFHLTEEGKRQVQIVAGDLKSKKIDLILVSPFARCQETAKIVGSALGLPEDSAITDERIGEFKKGSGFEGKKWDEYWKLFESTRERFEKAPDGGENLLDLNKRVGEFLYDIEKKYSGKNILIVSHGGPITAMYMVAEGADIDRCVAIKEKDMNAGLAELASLDFVPLPHNDNYELDLHKPYIDEINLVDENGQPIKRVKEVMDVWFDSGAMPFAEDHYPFENKDWIEGEGYPADYISEAIDQTRGWFYTLHAIGVLLDFGKAYKNVICLGHILDAEGKKMSKSIGNIIDPWAMMDKYGVDALRFWMYSVNQPGDSKNFDEKTVDEIIKKVFNPTENILSFYEMYKNENIKPENKSRHILDRWIISSVNKLIKEGGESLDRFKLFEPTRAARDFVGDFSTWYIRRSRDRFKSDNPVDRREALATTSFVLREFAKYLSPFTPFFAENLYLKLKQPEDPESVHLCEWPEVGNIDQEILTDMQEARNTVSLALEKRMSAGVKVRQPLQKLKIKRLKIEKLEEEYLELIKDEVNVKEIIFDEKLETEVELDTEITAELQKEGNVREFIRAVQDLRKNKNLIPGDSIELLVETDTSGQEFLNSVLEEVKKPTNVSEIKFNANGAEEISISGMKFKLSLL